MASFSDYRIPPPKDWNRFEWLCHLLWRKIWNDPNAQMIGRSGQSQAGVDIVGQPDRVGRWAGIQCKCREPDKKLKEKDLDEAVQAAKKFAPPLDEFILATTGPRDTKLQRKARELTDTNLANGLFSVAVWTWDDILKELEQHADICQSYCQGLPLDLDEVADGQYLTCVFLGVQGRQSVDHLYGRFKEVGKSFGLKVVRCKPNSCLTREFRAELQAALEASMMVLVETGDIGGQVGFELSYAVDRSYCVLLAPTDDPDMRRSPAAASMFADVWIEPYSYEQLYDDKAIRNLLEGIVIKSLENAARWCARVVGQSIQRAGRLPETLINPSLRIDGELFSPSNELEHQDKPFEDELFRQWSRPSTNGEQIAIIARWGRGKTVMLRRFIEWVKRRGEGAIKSAADVPPVVVLLKADDIPSDPNAIKIWRVVVEHVERSRDASRPTMLETFRASGRVFVLFDSLDEFSAIRRDDVAKLLYAFQGLRDHKKVNLIMTCREMIWKKQLHAASQLLDEFTVVEIQPYSRTKAAKILEDLRVQIHGKAKDDDGLPARWLCNELALDMAYKTFAEKPGGSIETLSGLYASWTYHVRDETAKFRVPLDFYERLALLLLRQRWTSVPLDELPKHLSLPDGQVLPDKNQLNAMEIVVCAGDTAL